MVVTITTITIIAIITITVIIITITIIVCITSLPEKISTGSQESHLEDVSAGVAPGGELRVVAGPTVDAVRLRPKLLVHQAAPTLGIRFVW